MRKAGRGKTMKKTTRFFDAFEIFANLAIVGVIAVLLVAKIS